MRQRAFMLRCGLWIVKLAYDEPYLLMSAYAARMSSVVFFVMFANLAYRQPIARPFGKESHRVSMYVYWTVPSFILERLGNRCWLLVSRLHLLVALACVLQPRSNPLVSDTPAPSSWM